MDKERGVLEAWDPVNQKLVWRTPGGGGIGGGVVTTAGNLVFQVINDGRLLPTAPIRARNCLSFRPAAPEWVRPLLMWWTESSMSR